ncbi:uncharacterized protein RJT21DRAFT_86679, partial [Scheffersomyces amazonensis]|uniref:uncharacterized protein n=1 Tax=Scheffersomyces amazonensis TaxID=1078765 RepID=UPI00315D0C50
PKPKLNREHKEHLQNFIDENPSALDEMMDSLIHNLEQMSVSQSTLYRYVSKEC